MCSREDAFKLGQRVLGLALILADALGEEASATASSASSASVTIGVQMLLGKPAE